ncbi:DNA-binding protein [Neurospora hispaniola]|uniref:DNA-binding protein n=1 Tax=Neurospora hispaniola TaxID=588809 RepID=A0AAJ0I1V4_9PEZI|nr:DNA-binding protein [Neurospora hispaniola]
MSSPVPSSPTSPLQSRSSQRHQYRRQEIYEEPPSQPLPYDSSIVLLQSFNNFFVVAIHNILYYRGIYPKPTFLSARAYNLPVHQNRHPKVCSWIRDAVKAVAAQIAEGRVSRIAVVIHSPLEAEVSSDPTQSASSQTIPPGSVLERWMFDVSRFPAWPGGAKPMRAFEKALAKEHRNEDSRDDEYYFPTAHTVSLPDLDEQLRGALRRMAHAAEKMDALPEGCTFTVAVELRDEALAPIGHPQAWIPSEPNLQPASRSKPEPGADVGGVKTTPIRSVEAGALFFECWLEEGKAKEMLKK